MSGIFGIFQRDGAFVDQIHMRSMLEGMRSWDVHGANTWRSGCIGLGHLLLQNTPESQYEHQPFVDEITGLAITSTSRLDNRDELLSSLGIPTDQHAILPDSALILEAYKKWGRACASHLLGDWCFAIWDEKEHNLFIARDTNGISGLYYYSTPQFFAFASSLVGLLALPQVPRILDENLLARTLAHLPLNSEHEVPTLYQGILHLGAAHAINVSVIAENLTEYWRIQDTPALLYRTSLR